MKKVAKLVLGMIVAVMVLAVFLLQFDALSTHALISGSCAVQPGYECINAAINTSGQLRFEFGQNTGTTEYNFELACYVLSAVNDQPTVGTGIYTSISNVGASLNQLATGRQVNISRLQCYDINGTVFASSTGARFSGWLWINYTNNSSAASKSNPWHTVKANLILKVS